jgi:hypothetical protein
VAGATACCATPQPVKVEVIQHNRFNLIRDNTLAPTHVAREGDST